MTEIFMGNLSKTSEPPATMSARDWLAHVLAENAAQATPRTSQHIADLQTALLCGMMDMYTICRSLRQWNTRHQASRDFKFAAAPRVPCVIVLFAGNAHTDHIKTILPRLSPTDVLYDIPNTQSQCLSLKKDYVCQPTDQSMGTLQYYRAITL